MLRHFFLIFIFFVLPGLLMAQNNLKGKVVDKASQESLPGAYVFLKNTDGETITASVSDNSGNFDIKKPREKNYLVEISFIGYSTYSKEISDFSGTNLGTVELEQEGALLDTYLLESTALTGEVKGDTVVFNANAFKTRPEAEANDLIRKMPGVVMNGNTIEVQGEIVGKVLVDGEPFFGDDPAMAMQNLPVAIIDKIEFLDEKSDQAILTGFDDGETVKTINIITKKEVRGGRFGKFYGGYGTGENYLAGGNINFFNGARRLSVLGLSNNINQQNFSADDLSGAFGEGSGGGGGGGRNSGNSLTTWERPGVTTTNSVGVNFSDKFDDGKAKITGSYFFNDSKNFLNRNSSREYVLSSDSLQLYREEKSENNHTQRHRLDLRLDYDFNEKHSLIWRPNLSFYQRNSTDIVNATNLYDLSTPISETVNSTQSGYESVRLNNYLTYAYKFNKKGRTISTSISTRLNNSDYENNLSSANQNFQTGNLDSLIQQSNTKGNSFNYRIQARYTEPVGENSQVSAQYRIGNDLSKNDQEVFKREMEATAFDLDSTLSNRFENTYLQHQMGLGYRFSNKKLRIFSSLDYEISNLNSDRLFPGYENTKRNFGNLVPRVTMDYDFNKDTNLRFGYRTNTDAPSVRQLQEVIDNRNPLQISTGNPDLDQQYEHRIFTRVRKMNPETTRSFFMYLSASVMKNYLGNSTFIAARDTLIQGDVLLRQGGQLRKPVNLDNFWNVRSYFSFGFPLKFMKSNLNLNTSANISNRPGLINAQLNNNKNIGFGQGVGISSNVGESLDFNVSTRGNYNIVRSSLQESLDNNYYSQTTRIDLYWNFAHNFFIGSNVNNTFYNGLGDEFDRSFWLMNLDLGYRFLPGRKAEVKFTVFDLLNQNTSIERNVTDVYTEDVNTQVLKQFFMLTFTYNLRAFGALDVTNN